MLSMNLDNFQFSFHELSIKYSKIVPTCVYNVRIYCLDDHIQDLDEIDY